MPPCATSAPVPVVPRRTPPPCAQTTYVRSSLLPSLRLKLVTPIRVQAGERRQRVAYNRNVSASEALWPAARKQRCGLVGMAFRVGISARARCLTVTVRVLTRATGWTVICTQPIPSDCGVYYYEVEVLSKGRDGYIGVGLSAASVNLGRLPGWEQCAPYLLCNVPYSLSLTLATLAASPHHLC